MAFHEVQFPPTISYGSAGGPGFSTVIVETDSGSEQRVARWQTPRRRYDAAYGVKKLEDIHAVQAFYIARKGPAYGFRFKDWLDFTSAADGQAAPTAGDQILGVGDGTTQSFQLRKQYVSGATTSYRAITKPVSGTVLAALDGTPTSLFAVDTTSGIITFTTAPGSGVVVTAGCEFDVPVRFGDETDQSLAAAITDFNNGEIHSITMVEILDGVRVDDDRYFGGSKEVAPSTPVTINRTALLWSIDPQGADVQAFLPNTTGLPLGGPLFVVVNASTHTNTVGNTRNIILKKSTGEILATLTPGTALTLYLTRDGGGSYVWYGI